MTRRARRGSALASALVALVVIAALGAGAALASREARRAAHDELAQLRAAAAAEGAVERSVGAWDRRRSLLAPGASDSVFVAGDPGVVVRALRLDVTRLLVEATARVRAAAPGAAGFAERTTSLVARLARPEPGALAAVTVGGALDVPGDAVIDGRDTPPPGWSGCWPPRADTAAIAAPPTAVVRVAPGAAIVGAVQGRAAAADTATLLRGDRWAALAARADLVVSGAWAPGPPDGTYPVVYAGGSLTLRGPARAQGTLLVDGDLTVDGDVAFAGAIVVRGALHAGPGALLLHGALRVAGGPNAIAAGSRVTFSQCAVARAADFAAQLSPDRRRSWAEVTR